jgi:signal peptide peptidase SppA
MFNLKSDLWFGDAKSLQEALAIEERITKMLSAIPEGKSFSTMTAAPRAEGEEALPRLYSRNANVGVITLRGPMINTENIFTEMFDVTTYPAIREALAFAAQDESVTDILLDIESPGGQVSGTNDVAKMVKQIDSTMKPVHAFSDSLVASAAYWIASGARKINVGETAIVGSIGVIATMQSVHKALEKEGIEVKVIRAGKNKALGHPAEPISEKAVAQMQAHADALYEIFTDTVSANRAELKPAKKSEWAEGNEFLGQEAVDAGLADAVTSFDKVFSKLVQTVDAAGTPNNNAGTRTRGMQMKPRAVLDPKIVAAIEAGAPLTAEQEALAAAAMAAAATPTIDAPAAADAAAAAAAAPAAEPAADELTAYLEAGIAKRDAEILALNVKLAAATEKNTSMEGAHVKLRAIAEASVSKLNIALGGSAVTCASLSDAELVAKHEALAADFTKNFKIDGVASVTPEKDAAPAGADVTPIQRARLHAVGLARPAAK